MIGATNMFKYILFTALCGFSASQPSAYKWTGRIVQGAPIDITEVPYQVALGNSESIWCGGSIIRERFIITAAHCFNDYDLSEDFIIYAGMSSLTKITGDMLHLVRQVTVDPRYNRETHNFDIAVVELQIALHFDARIQPVELAPAFEVVPVGVVAYASGWGRLSDGGQTPTQLQGVGLTILASESCNGYGQFDSERMLCAGSLDGSVDTCQGDSGGPLVYNGLLYGVVSFGNGCATPGFPGVYANVANLRDFVDQIIN